MQISVFGRTDKRACIYTLMKILQPLGDVAVITSKRHFMRLTLLEHKILTFFGYSR